MSENLVVVENLGKKFCRNLKRSLWYGVKDIGAELVGSKRAHTVLRKQEFWALQDVNFEIKRGELVGLIGPNGAGKTTLLKLLSGLVKPDKGSVAIRGKIQALIALGAGFNPILTGRENVYVNGAILGFSKKQMDGMLEEILDFSEIEEFIDMPVQSYSSGMHVRLGFAVAVNLKPDILIVDEVLAVGDAGFRRKARNKMMELLHSGISVLFVSHNQALISSLTSRCIYLDKGIVRAVGPSDEVTALYLSDAIQRNKKNQVYMKSELMESAYLTVPDILTVEQVDTLDEAGHGTAQFNTFDSIGLQLEITLLKKMAALTLAFTIRDQVDDIVVTSSKTTLAARDPGVFRVKCYFNKTPLREGLYHVGFYASDFDGGALYKSHQVTSFTILADMSIIQSGDSTRGLVVMDTSWQMLS